MSEKEIRKKLETVLKDNPNEYGKILELSTKLAGFDEENVRFSVDAGAVNRLGKELVARHETAVSELVKNAYDADALVVNLYFENAREKGGTLTIEDDGTGMNKEQLVKGFMRISSSDKIHNPKSDNYNRTRAGRKGIGRFATQRLGSRLTIITQTKQSAEALKIVIAWDDFAIDSDLITIGSTIEKIPKIKEEGTNLIIENLRDSWSDAMISRVFRYVSELIQPFPLSKKLKKSSTDPGFKANFYRVENGENVAIANEEENLFKYALAEVEGYVEEEKIGYYSFKSARLNLNNDVRLIGKEKTRLESKKYPNDELPFLELTGVHIKAYYYIYNNQLIPKLAERSIREKASEQGGIRVYRNGFRVLPYAEEDDDWVGLDLSVRKRTILPVHGNHNFFGFVEIYDTKGERFEELSSREGLLENTAFDELRSFVYRVLQKLALEVAAERDIKQKTNSKKEKAKTSNEIIDEVIEELEDVAENKEGKTTEESVSSVKMIVEKVKEAKQKKKEEEKELISELGMLRVLAGLGLVIGEFTHEIKHYFAAFNADADGIIDFLTDNPKWQKRAKRLKQNVMSFESYTSYFEKAVSQNVRREVEPIELRDPVNSFLETLKDEILEAGIDFQKPVFKGYDLFTCPMHTAEWASILFNFYSNAKKAIKKTDHSGKILIEAGEYGNNVYLEFSDNGIGIPDESKDKIFNAWFTTSQPKGNHADEIEGSTGTGLGLKIIRDIIEGYGGEVFVDTPKDGYTTTIRIELPRYHLNEDDEE